MSIKKVEFCECDKGALHKYYYDLIMSNIAEISHKNIKIEAVFDFFKNVDSVSGVTDFDNVLVKSYKDDIIEIEDKYKIVSRGFDKWSFRKEPKRK